MRDQLEQALHTYFCQVLNYWGYDAHQYAKYSDHIACYHCQHRVIEAVAIRKGSRHIVKKPHTVKATYRDTSTFFIEYTETN